jgi:hypothetical protein
LEEPPLGKLESSIILSQDFKVSSRMLADRTFFWDFLPFEDITAIPAVPFHRRIFFECLSFLQIF